jgi:hypothetical protein
MERPPISEELAARAVAAVKGPTQREQVEAMAGFGYITGFRGRWAAAQWRPLVVASRLPVCAPSPCRSGPRVGGGGS